MLDVAPKPDTGLPEATLFLGGAGVDPARVTRVLGGVAPARAALAPTPRWFWTTAGKVESPHPDDHLRAVLDLVVRLAVAGETGAGETGTLRTSLFLPAVRLPSAPSPALIEALRAHGQVTLDLGPDAPVQDLAPLPQTLPRSLSHSISATS